MKFVENKNIFLNCGRKNDIVENKMVCGKKNSFVEIKIIFVEKKIENCGKKKNIQK